MHRSDEIRAAGIRLVQAAYHTRSLALYTKLGFEPREPLTNFTGTPPKIEIQGRQVRQATEADMQACNQVCEFVHGHNRGGELADSIKTGAALVVEHGGRITGYTTGLVRPFRGRVERGHRGHDIACRRFRRARYPRAYEKLRPDEVVSSKQP